jgi:hypothetical protein
MSTSSNLLLALGVALGALACSEEKTPDAAPPSFVLVDDLEGTTGRIAWQPETTTLDALPGRWISYADIQCNDLSPVPEWAPDGSGAWHTTEHAEPVETMPGVVSQSAARLVTNAALVNTWGAGMGFEFYEPPPGTETTLVTRPCSGGARPDLEYPALAVDLSEYSGLVFWGMANPDAGTTKVLVQFQDANTDPRGNVCDPTPESIEACYNGFGVRLELSDELTRYEIDFSKLRQNPLWGYHPAEGNLELERVYGLSFQVDTPGGACLPPDECLGGPPKLSFDIWIDDLYFMKR